MGPFLSVLAYALIPFAAILGGGMVGLYQNPGPRLRSMILHFAAGVMFSIVAVELLPDIISRHKPLEVLLGFGAGVGLMLLIQIWTKQFENEGSRKGGAVLRTASQIPYRFLLVTGIDVFIDGSLLGIGFAAGARQGVLFTFALAVELLSLGLATSTTLGGLPRRTAIGSLVALATIFLIGAMGGTLLLQGVSNEVLEIILSFGLAALLFLVTEELLVEAHEEPETPLLTSMFFAGFLLFLLLGMME